MSARGDDASVATFAAFSTRDHGDVEQVELVEHAPYIVLPLSRCPSPLARIVFIQGFVIKLYMLYKLYNGFKTST